MPHITQVAGVDSVSKTEFSTYVLPKIPIEPGAEKATSITFDGTRLQVKGKPVAAIPIKEALSGFLGWLRPIPNVVLVAHNGRTFDFRVLSYAMEKCGLRSDFQNVTSAFMDTLTTMRTNIPKLPSYTQENLAIHFQLPKYNAHNAIDDVLTLDKIMTASKLSDSQLMKSAYNPQNHFQQELFNSEKTKNIGSLHELVAKGVVKMCMAENIAGSGLALPHLRLIHSRDGEDGLTCVFSSKNSQGKPRVTATPKVLQTVIPKLCEFFALSLS